MQPASTVDHTIVVRIWVEPDDERPRCRLVRLGTEAGESDEVTAVGRREIGAAFAAMLAAVLDATDS